MRLFFLTFPILSHFSLCSQTLKGTINTSLFPHIEDKRQPLWVVFGDQLSRKCMAQVGPDVRRKCFYKATLISRNTLRHSQAQTLTWSPNKQKQKAGGESESGQEWDFPGGPLVRTPCFPWRGCSSIPGERTKIPHASGPKKQNIKQSILTNSIQTFKEMVHIKTNLFFF